MSEFLLSIKIEPLEEGGYLATSDDLPELLAQGRTVAETLEIARTWRARSWNHISITGTLFRMH